MALSALTMCRKQYHHSPYSLLKISFCFRLLTNTELSTCNPTSATTALERFPHLSRTIQLKLTSCVEFKSAFVHWLVVIVLCCSAAHHACLVSDNTGEEVLVCGERAIKIKKMDVLLLERPPSVKLAAASRQRELKRAVLSVIVATISSVSNSRPSQTPH